MRWRNHIWCLMLAVALVVRARIWLGQELRVMVRISGIDTPELRGSCAHERKLARAARDFVKQRVGQRKIALSDIRQDRIRPAAKLDSTPTPQGRRHLD